MPTPKDDQTRIIEQLVVNQQRADIIDADQTSALTELDGLGVTADQIVKKTSIPKKRVEQALAVSSSAFASEVMASTAVTLEHAAAIVEFDADLPAAEELKDLAINDPGRFNHRVEYLRGERARLQAIEDLKDELAAAGYDVIDQPANMMTPKLLRIDALYTDKALKNRAASTMHDKLPADTAGLSVFISEYVDGRYRQVPKPVFVIADWQSGFYAQKHYYSESTSSGSSTGGGLSEEEKAKRKVVRENNKLWQPATIVRRAWVKEFLQRKELPKDAVAYTAKYFGHLPHWNPGQSEQLRALLGIKSADRASITKLIDDDPTRSLNVLLAAALAEAEGEYDFGKDGWRRSIARTYLTQLSAWGYTLSDIEQAVVKGTADKGVNV